MNKKDLKSGQKIKKKRLNIQKFDVLIFMTVIIIFVACLLAFSPALMTSDSPDQLNQAITGKYNDAHPMFHSFLVGNIYKITGTVSGIAIVQVLVFAIIWTIACKITREKTLSINKIFQYILTLIICFIPINFMFSITLWKDILYSYAFLGIILCIYIGIQKSYNYSFLEMFLVSLSLVFIYSTRHNGVPIALVLFLILLVLNIVKNKKILKGLVFTAIFVSTLIISFIPKWYYKVENNSTGSTFVSAATYSMGAILNQDIEFEEDELKILNSIMNIDKWKQLYDPYSSVALHFDEDYNRDYLAEHEEEFMAIFKKYAIKYPEVILEHYAELDSIIWSVPERAYMHTVITNNNSIREMSNGKYETEPKSQYLNQLFTDIISTTKESNILYTLLYRPATYMYLAVILILYIAIKQKKWDYILLLFPMFLNIGTYILFLGSQDLRYFYPNFLTVYFIILVIAKMKLCVVEESSEEKEEEMEKRTDKVLIVIPAYNEALNIEKTIKDVKENASGYDYLIINDCSKDNTKEVCEKNGFNYISLPINYGLASGVQIGMKYALENDYDVAIQFDGDGQHKAEYIKDLVNGIKEGADITIGSRFVTEKKPFSTRMIGNTLLSFVIRVLTGKRIKDPTSGMRAYDKKCIEELAINMNLPPEPDMLVYMINKGMDIKEVQVKMEEREFGESYLSAWRSVRYMLEIITSIVFIRSFSRNKKTGGKK